MSYKSHILYVKLEAIPEIDADKYWFKFSRSMAMDGETFDTVLLWREITRGGTPQKDINALRAFLEKWPEYSTSELLEIAQTRYWRSKVVNDCVVPLGISCVLSAVALGGLFLWLNWGVWSA